MDLLIPREVLEQFGTLKGPLLGRAAWQIPVENLEEICAALTSMGWELEPAQELPFL